MIALITGISGQDGYYTAQNLLGRGLTVFGLTSNRSNSLSACADLVSAGLEIIELNYERPMGISRVIESVKPNYIVNLAAKTSGQKMFEDPVSLSHLNATLPLEILEAIKLSGRRDDISFVQASSSEMFGLVDQDLQDEHTPMRPLSPYGAAKLFAHNLVGIYRSNFELRASSAILFNHESRRRPQEFVTRKIATAAARIKLGLQREVELGDLDIRRDWGYAPEYCDAMVRMVMAPKADDYVVATGTTSSLKDVLEFAFGHVGLDPNPYVKINPKWVRKTQTRNHSGNATKIKNALGWESKRPLNEIIREMVDHELALQSRHRQINRTSPLQL